jgi:hypothetical protein
MMKKIFANGLVWVCLLSLAAGATFFRSARVPSQLLPNHAFGNPQPPDLARANESRSPLLAGDFAGALRALPAQIASHPGDARFSYSLATVYLRLMRYAQGIPYALEAVRDDPLDVRYRWMLRVLTILAGKPLDSIPLQYRLVVPPPASSPVHFVDVTQKAGAANFGLGRGTAWGDFDNDGRDDLLVCAERAPFRLFRNLGGGKFKEVAEQLGLHDPVGLGCYGAYFVDYDNDGFEDIFLTSNGWGGDNRLFLFHNDHGRRFEDLTAKAGLAGKIDAFGAAWADYDGDGYLDVAVATGIAHAEGDRLRLYHNQRDGTFSEVGLKARLAKKARWMSTCWIDYDGDGRPDLFAVSFDSGCTLYHNLGDGQFQDVTQKAGLHCPISNYTCDILDYNNDGRPDIFVSTYPVAHLKLMIAHQISGAPAPLDDRQLLFRNNGDGTFSRATEQAGIMGLHGAMASQVADVDNDGYPDIVLGTGNPALDWTEPKALYHNDGRGHFTDIAQSAGLIDFGMLHGTAFSDYDNSGNLSFYGSFGGFYWGSREEARLFQNSGCGNHALEVKLTGRKSNRDAIGAHLTATIGGQKYHAWVDGGSGFGSMNSRIIHLGLGSHREVDLLEVDWPGGLHQRFTHIPSDDRIEIVEGASKFRLLVRF